MAKEKIAHALLEVRDAINEAEALTAKSEVTKRDEARISVLLAKVAALRSQGIAPSDSAQRWLKAFLRGHELPLEVRDNDILAGKQTISYTQGAAGGFLVPQEIHDEVLLGLAQYDPLLDPDVVTVVPSKGFDLNPYTVPGWDLSAFAAAKVSEGAQQNPLAVPTVSGKLINSYTYRATLAATFEFEDDTFQPTMDLMEMAYAIAFARGIGVDLVTGNGTTAPQGIVTGAHDSGITTASASSTTYLEIENIYFALNNVYRAMPKCAWVFNDAYYQEVRKAVDTTGRPLINIVDDQEILMGKPVYTSPSMPTGTATKGIIFGDLSYYVVRVSQMILKRNLQAAGYVEKALGLYTGLMRADAKVIDPTGGGVNSPIISATFV